ncbi:serine carboxypeptidase-like [Arachis stenosperma]|uniref:serine carboxypeptidase-like n=1 Tax=Arachis stenosperma TaxID=217475 RepID=UPI0025AC5B7C|nr:serine carboxypeptidase-like [Arachis stenosperma]
MASPSLTLNKIISHPFLFFLFFFFFIFSCSTTLSYAIRTSPSSINNSNDLHHVSRAERLIRSLNLFPTKPANIIRGGVGDDEDENVFVPGKIVEKNFSFLSIADSDHPSVDDLGHHAGYYALIHTKAARMFYFFFESRNNKDDPVVIWLTGGPGCGSELALFYENGPFKITNNLSLVWNDYGWDKASNILFVDQPTGTGFSYTSDDSDIRHDENGVSNDLYDFLQAFFKEHSEFVNNDFYITGESYAGHYIPALASRVHQGNKNQEGIHINFKGFAIGNGLTNPGIQYKAYTDYALDNQLITKDEHQSINKLIPPCEQAIQTCAKEGEKACVTAYGKCESIFDSILSITGNINYYDIRKKCEVNMCYDLSSIEKFLNQEKVREALGVGKLEFVSCSKTVYYAMKGDWMKNLEVDIPNLLEDGIRLLVYAGEEHLICNWLGNSRWVHAMKWSGQEQFGASPTIQFVVNGSQAGSLKSYGPLAFLKVNEAGHLVPMDQPEAALEMITRWMKGTLTVT